MKTFLAALALIVALPISCQAGGGVTLASPTATTHEFIYSGRPFAVLSWVQGQVNDQKSETLAPQPERPDGAGGEYVTYRATDYDLVVHIVPISGKPYAKMLLSVVNKVQGARAVTVTLHFDRIGAPARKAIVFATQGRFNSIPLVQKLSDSHTLGLGWGCNTLYPWRQYSMYLPVFGLGTHQATVMMCDPGSAFGFDSESNWVEAARKFYPGSAVGSVDKGIDLGKVIGFAKDAIYIGCANHPSWAELYWNFCVSAFPASFAKPKIDVGPTMDAGCEFKITPRWIARLRSYGIHSIGMASAGAKVSYYKPLNDLDTATVHRCGLKATMSIDRFTRDVANEKGYGLNNVAEPSLEWQNVRDALILGSNGKPAPSWWGMAANMSPKYSFGRNTLALVEKKVSRYNFDGVTEDFYLDGDGAEFTHKFANLPFYPSVVYDAQFLTPLSQWLHKRGKFLHLNCVNPASLPLLRLCDSESCDCGVEQFFKWKLVNGPRPMAVLGGTPYPKDAFTTKGWLEEGMRGLFFGCCVPAWCFAREGADRLTNNVFFLLDPEKGRPMFARNCYFGYALSQSMLVGGDAEDMTSLFYKSADGMYLAYRNLPDRPVVHEVDFAHRRLDVNPHAFYTVFRWDADKGATLIYFKAAGRAILKPMPLHLDAGQTSFVCAIPFAKRTSLKFASFPSARVPYLSSTTDAPIRTSFTRGGRVSYQIDGFPREMAEMEFALPDRWRASAVKVKGAREYSVRIKPERIIVKARESGPLSVTLIPSAGRSRALANGTVLTDHKLAPAIRDLQWEPASGKWSVSPSKLVLAKRTSSPAIVRLKTLPPADYELEFDVTRTTVDMTPQQYTEVILGAQGGKDLSVNWSDAFTLRYDHSQDRERGIETAMYPNPYTKYIRSYRLRIDKSGHRVEVYLSYDSGLSYENVGGFDLPNDLKPQLGFALTN
ncbi:MAG: hypothetical protein M1335_05610, partial [Chloroflexi bacterium]|nr:hypothetical protein [Chloroflexota bacterium]